MAGGECIEGRLPKLDYPTEIVSTIDRVYWYFVSGLTIWGLSNLITKVFALKRLCFQPGHWVVLGLGVSTLMAVATQSLHLFGTDQRTGFPRLRQTEMTLFTLGMVSSIATWTMAIRMRCNHFSKLWTTCFVLLILCDVFTMLAILSPSMFYWHPVAASWYTGIFQTIPGLAIAICAVQDHKNTTKHDWLHWNGVLIAILWAIRGFAGVLIIAYYTYFYSAQPL